MGAQSWLCQSLRQGDQVGSEHEPSKSIVLTMRMAEPPLHRALPY